jgi:hypothetical protein
MSNFRTLFNILRQADRFTRINSKSLILEHSFQVASCFDVEKYPQLYFSGLFHNVGDLLQAISINLKEPYFHDLRNGEIEWTVNKLGLLNKKFSNDEIGYNFLKSFKRSETDLIAEFIKNRKDTKRYLEYSMTKNEIKTFRNNAYYPYNIALEIAHKENNDKYHFLRYDYIQKYQLYEYLVEDNYLLFLDFIKNKPELPCLGKYETPFNSKVINKLLEIERQTYNEF